MDTGLKGKIALVCAASKGLGRAAAHALAREGARVAICARGAEALRAAADAIARDTGADVFPIVADVAVAADTERVVAGTVAHFGGLDVLVTNAGGPKSAAFEALTDADWLAAVDLTLMSTVRLIRHAIPHLRARGGGRIVNITSVSVKQPIDNLVLSNALRAAVVGLAKTLSLELAKDGILVNSVAPGYTRTDRVLQLAQAGAEREGVTVDAILERQGKNAPLGRIGEPEELAALIVFLASARASYITGTTIQVDGGSTRSLL